VNLNFEYVPDPSLGALVERVNGIADSRGIGREEAMRQALVQWASSMGSGGGSASR
jgi:hypothetical protein